MTATQAALQSAQNKAAQSHEVAEAMKQVQSAVDWGERQCWLAWKLNTDQAAYIRGLGYNLTYPNNNGALTW